MPGETNKPRGLLLVISGPSGVGKSTIVKRLIDDLDGVFSVSATTRPATAGEVDGVDYFFVSDEQFQAMIAKGAFLEYACVFGRHSYGTPREAVNERLLEGRLVVLDIDVQGALQVKERMPEAFMVFLKPPSEAELLRRLQSRGRDDAEAIQRRFAEAKTEMRLAEESDAYDLMLTNDDLDRTIETARQAIVDRMRAASHANSG